MRHLNNYSAGCVSAALFTPPAGKHTSGPVPLAALAALAVLAALAAPAALHGYCTTTARLLHGYSIGDGTGDGTATALAIARLLHWPAASIKHPLH